MDIDRKCPSCGGTMIFLPGFDSLQCQSCGHKEIIPELVSKVPVEEMDFLTAQNTASHDWGMEARFAGRAGGARGPGMCPGKISN